MANFAPAGYVMTLIVLRFDQPLRKPVVGGIGSGSRRADDQTLAPPAALRRASAFPSRRDPAFHGDWVLSQRPRSGRIRAI